MSEVAKARRDFALSPGQWLRALRHECGLKIKDVEEASGVLARTYNHDEFRVSASRLSEIENRDLTPNIYKLYSLAAIYRVPYPELLEHYGIDLQRALHESVKTKAPAKNVAARSGGR